MIEKLRRCPFCGDTHFIRVFDDGGCHTEQYSTSPAEENIGICSNHFKDGVRIVFAFTESGKILLYNDKILLNMEDI